MSSQDQKISSYDETQYYPRAAEESETESAATTEEEPPIPNTSQPVSPDNSSLVKATQEETSQVAISDKEKTVEEPQDDNEKGKGKDAITKSEDTPYKDIMCCGVCFQLLLDPVTLNCGHSFCLVCLAQLWNISRSPLLLCPMCRQPWAEPGGRLPSVNVTIREVLEQNYPVKIKERRENLTQEETNLINQYNQGASPRTFGSERQRRPINVQVVMWVFLAALCTVFLLVFCAVSVSLWLFGGVNDHYMRKPVPLWTNDDVMDWFKGLGNTVQKDSREIFEREKFDGRHLLKLTDPSLLEYGLLSDTSRNSLLLSIDQLKESQKAPPRNFHEFLEANKEDAVLTLITYKVFPRLTFCYLYLFQYYSLFLPVVQDSDVIREEPTDWDLIDPSLTKDKVAAGHDDVKSIIQDDMTNTQLIAILLEILLVPHLVVATYALTGIQSEPFLSSIVLLHCIVATLREVKNLRNKLRTRPGQGQTSIWSWLKTGLIYCIFYFILLGIGHFTCFVLPYFVLNIIFYFLILHTLYSLLHARFFKPVFQSVARFGIQGFFQFLNNR